MPRDVEIEGHLRISIGLLRRHGLLSGGDRSAGFRIEEWMWIFCTMAMTMT